jgi:hypothetical protein
MTIKDLVLKVNDVLCYIIFALICITAAIIGMTSGPIYGAGLGICGLILFSLMSGYWFVLSSIASNTARQVVLQEQQNKLLGKIYKQMQDDRNNPFDTL